jgi:hypothetical protein
VQTKILTIVRLNSRPRLAAQNRCDSLLCLACPPMMPPQMPCMPQQQMPCMPQQQMPCMPGAMGGFGQQPFGGLPSYSGSGLSMTVERKCSFIAATF